MRLGWGVRATADQLALVALTASLVISLHLVLSRTQIGRSMRAVSENRALARIAGVLEVA